MVAVPTYTILIYKSFFAQIEANKIQRESLTKQLAITQAQQDFNILMDIFKQIKKDYDSLFFTTGNREYKVKLAVARSKRVFKDDPDKAKKQSFMNDFRYLVRVFSLLIEKMLASNVSKQDKDLMTNLFLLFYATKLELYVGNLAKICAEKKIAVAFKNAMNKLIDNIGVLKK